MPTPYAESIVLSHPSASAHYYADEGGWEMSKVCTETYMKTDWSVTEIYKINEIFCMVWLRYQTELKIKVYLNVMLCHWTSSSWLLEGS
jgi:hypothetical protein